MSIGQPAGDVLTRYVAIVYKNDKKAELMAQHAAGLLRDKGFELWLERADDNPVVQHPADLKPEFVLSLGGDGTLLYAARVWGFDGAPLFGVNLGHLGFLAETEPEDFPSLLQDVLLGKAAMEKRMAIKVKILRDGQTYAESLALNEAVINKGAPARIISLKVAVQNFGEWSFRADGLIVSTPTGSTAYNMSAGGPVVYPTIPALVITPICPFTLSSRPLVLPSDFPVEVMAEGHDRDIHLTVDGQVDYILHPGDKVLVSRHRSTINLVISPNRNFIDVLRHKLSWA